MIAFKFHCLNKTWRSVSKILASSYGLGCNFDASYEKYFLLMDIQSRNFGLNDCKNVKNLEVSGKHLMTEHQEYYLASARPVWCSASM